jgi:predicted Zn-dependent protease
VRNPIYLSHAARIAARLNDADGAKKFAQEALSLDPSACVEPK